MPGNELVQSVLRSLDIVEAVARSDDGLTLHRLSEDLGLKPPTVYNLAKTLLARRFLERSDRPPRYRLGPAALGLSDAYWDRALVRRGSSAVKELAEALGDATVILAEPVGGEVMMRLRVSPETSGLLEQPRGRAMHPYATSCALVFQALWSEEDRAAFRQRHPFEVLGAHIWESVGRLDEALGQIRRNGYAAPGLVGTAGRSVAAPVFGPGGEIVAALGVSGSSTRPANRVSKALIAKVVQAAKRLSDGK